MDSSFIIAYNNNQEALTNLIYQYTKTGITSAALDQVKATFQGLLDVTPSIAPPAPAVPPPLS